MLIEIIKKEFLFNFLFFACVVQRNPKILKFDFSVLAFDFLKFSPFPLLKGRKTPLLNSKSVKVTKNVIDF